PSGNNNNSSSSVSRGSTAPVPSAPNPSYQDLLKSLNTEEEQAQKGHKSAWGDGGGSGGSGGNPPLSPSVSGTGSGSNHPRSASPNPVTSKQQRLLAAQQSYLRRQGKGGRGREEEEAGDVTANVTPKPVGRQGSNGSKLRIHPVGRGTSFNKPPGQAQAQAQGDSADEMV
ncbi:hypothetical protein B484DRAFT_457782, partial [Ochromonadaceae sp. CCMP2298]